MQKIFLLTIWITLFILPGIILASTSEKRLALVIGNSDYMSSPLANPMNDAISMEAALKDCNFDVIRRLNLNEQAMFEAIREFGNRLKRFDVGLFYYAGHGIQIEGINYLVPIEADVEAADEVSFKCIEASLITKKMETAGNRLNIIMLDACRNNPFRSFRSKSRGLAAMEAPEGTIIQYAAKPGTQAIDYHKTSKNNGLYTSKLLKYIKTPGLNILDMFQQVRIDVYQASKQKQTPCEFNSLMGKFYFKPLLAEVTTLKINVKPENATIRILNIREKFYQGMTLTPGQYHLEISKSGYETYKKWITINAGDKLNLNIDLKPLSRAKQSFTNISVIRKAALSQAIKGDLYIMSIGVNELKHIPYNNLKFPAKDAVDIVTVMKTMKGKLFKSVHATIFSDYSDQKPISTDIEDELYTLRNATKNDTVMLFLAGHGVRLNDREYIFLTRNAKMRPNNSYRMSTVLKWSKVIDAFRKINARRIVFLDTCYSGNVNATEMAKMGSDSEIVIFSSSTGYETSQELDKLQNGIFTHAICKGLTHGIPADMTKDNEVDINELAAYVKTEVKRHNPEQTPNLAAPNGVSFPFFLR